MTHSASAFLDSTYMNARTWRWIRDSKMGVNKQKRFKSKANSIIIAVKGAKKEHWIDEYWIVKRVLVPDSPVQKRTLLRVTSHTCKSHHPSLLTMVTLCRKKVHPKVNLDQGPGLAPNPAPTCPSATSKNTRMSGNQKHSTTNDKKLTGLPKKLPTLFHSRSNL
jgi:hypothetical protein